MELNVLNEQGKTVEAADAVFGREYNEALVHQIVVAFQANARLGTRVSIKPATAADVPSFHEKRPGARRVPAVLVRV